MIKVIANALVLGLASAWKDLPSINADDFSQYNISQPIDHYNYQNEDTYSQRFWKSDKYYDPAMGGPVFLYICGEYTCSIDPDRLFPFMVGASHGAELYAIEHRFYGESIPYNNLSIPNYKFLSSEQALSDIAYFIQNITYGHLDRQVVVIGGSYPGGLSAWFKQRYPQMAVASWASSAMLYPVKDYNKFDQQIYDSTIKSGDWCPKAIQNIFKYVDEGVTGDNSTLKEEIMNKMGASSDMNTGDFEFYFADIFVETVQYGNRTGLCQMLLDVKDLNESDQLQAIYEQAQVSGVAPSSYCRKAMKNETPSEPTDRSWTYQFCTEFGLYQVPSDKNPMRPSLLNETYWVDYCNDIFGINNKIERTIAEFNGRHTRGSNTIFTSGVEDPWKWLTELNPNEDINQISYVADCDDCGHCADLYTPKDSDPQELKDVRTKVQKFIEDVLNIENEQQTFMQ